MSAQRARSAVEASHRSIHPYIPGVPWWGALLIAVTATTIGYGIDAGSGHKELTHAFAGLYIAGCVAAVLAVRQEGVFAATIQPPLILFCAVPGAYWLFHGRKIGNLKDLLINCGYPLIERFPLMLGTAGGVLLIGLIRWYFGMSHATAAVATGKDDAETAGTPHSFISTIVATLNSLLRLNPSGDDAGEASGSKRTRATTRTPKTGRAARGGRSASRPSRTRPPLEDQQEPVAERSRRPGHRGQAPPRDFEPADPPGRPRRRPRPQGDADLPREARRDPRHTRRNPYERPYEEPVPRGGRFDGYDMYEPYEPRRRRTAPGGSNGANPTHHPISRVRYRGSNPANEPGAEPRDERWSRSRAPGRSRAESWEYDT